MFKNLKKISSVLLLLVLAVSLAGCGNGGNKLTMATNAEFPPFEYIENGEVVGVDVEIAEAVAKKLGKELEVTNIDFDAALTGASTGKYDMAVAGITASEDRCQNMNFSIDYYKASQAIIVMSDSEISGKDMLQGKTIACQEGTTGEQYLLDNSYSVQSFKTGAEAVSAMTSGKVDAVVIDNAVANALSAKQYGATKVLGEALTEETYAIALKKGNDKLTEQINGAIEELKADGTLAKIFDKYELPYDAE